MIHLYPFNIPFKDTFKTSKGNFEFREGILVSFTHHSHRFFAEISPLPGFSVSDLESCTNIFSTNASKIDEFLIGILNNHDGDYEIHSILEIVEKTALLTHKWIKNELPTQLIPEIQFAIDHIIFQILAARNTSESMIPADLIIPINANVKTLMEATNAYKSGIKTVKVKVGMDADHESSLIKNIRDNLPDISIRLDANGAWDFKSARSFIEQVQSFDIEYIEQPVSIQEFREYGPRLRNLGIQIAADESARSYLDVVSLIDNNSTDILILKPPMIGNFKNLLNIYELALRSNIPCVFTSSLDSSINRRFAALLGFVFGSKKLAHGFGTGSLFKSDITILNDNIQNGNLIVPISGISVAEINSRFISKTIC